MQALLLHKFRRAPYGGGKFWNGLKQVVRMFLESAHPEHPLLELLGESICNDYGTTLAACGGDCRPFLQKLLQEAKGPRVECRRWYTIYDAGLRLIKLWHSMLLGMMVWFLAEGKDPWATVAERKQVVHDEDGDEFDYKTQTLLTLSDSMHQQLLASQLVVFQRVWTEHKQYSAIATMPAECLMRAQRWSSYRRWASHMVAGTLDDAFCQSGKHGLLGLETGTAVAWPEALGMRLSGSEDDGGILFPHIQLAMSVAYQMLIFGFAPQSLPWVFSLLLVPDERTETLDFMRRTWELKTFLESSKDPLHLSLRKFMHFLGRTFVTEVLELFNLAEWKFGGPWAEKAVACIEATFAGVGCLVYSSGTGAGCLRMLCLTNTTQELLARKPRFRTLWA